MNCHNFTQNASTNLLFRQCAAEPIATYVNSNQFYTDFYQFFDSSILPVLFHYLLFIYLFLIINMFVNTCS